MQKRNTKFYRPAKVIAITGGKGGIGKTSIAINLSIALAAMSQKVMLLDADLGLANVDLMLGLRTINNISDVLNEKCTLQDAILTGPKNIQIIPSGSGDMQMASISYTQIANLVNTVSEISAPPNYLLIDTAAGIAESVIGFAAAADEIFVIVCNEPASIADAYALIKVLNKQFSIHRFRVITNKIREIGESAEVFAKLTRVADKFLDISLTLVGSIPEDKFMSKSIRQAKALIIQYPYSASATAFYEIAKNIIKLPAQQLLNGNIQFFQKQLLVGVEEN